MQINLSGAGKRFNREWIFKNADLRFSSGNSYAITGPNGSGKSTFLQCVGGLMQLSEGKISFNDEEEIAAEKVYQSLSFCAPYLELLEEMTLKEFLFFHKGFKPFLNNYSEEEVASIVDLKHAYNKQIRYYSSGMKQRVKLAQAILSGSELILLDEPCSNLDAKGIALYHSLINEYCKDRLVIVSSNDEVEYGFCKERISIIDFKINQSEVASH
jgi:ABC-type multidrug transport system ATPase subunit